jgi:uncharacterized protein with FMN-binding domain
MRRPAAALAVTAAAVVLLARYDTHLPRRVNPESALKPHVVASRPGTKTATGPATITPFSTIQVRVTLTHGRLTAVKTVALSGDGPHTNALNRRAEPILRAEALKAGSADIDVVSGATYTSRSWRDSLQQAIALAERR